MSFCFKPGAGLALNKQAPVGYSVLTVTVLTDRVARQSSPTVDYRVSGVVCSVLCLRQLLAILAIFDCFRMPVVENEFPEGNAEGLKILRESLKKVQISTEAPADASHVFVVFGASGDLAKKKIYPTLWALFRDGLMPPGTQIFGYARSKMTVAQMRERCAGTVKAKEGEEEMLEQFWSSNHYVAGSYDTQRDFEMLNQVRESRNQFDNLNPSHC